MAQAVEQSVRRRSRRSKGDLREEQILDALGAVLAEKSMESVTIDDISTAAGISRTTFYFYFPSKQAVLARLMEEVSSRFAETHGWLHTVGPSPDSLREQLDGAAAIWRDSAPILACTLQDPHTRTGYAPLDEFIVSTRHRYVAGLTDKIARDQAAGLAPDDVPPPTLASLVELMREGRLSQLADAPEEAMPEGLDELARAILRLIYGRTA